MTWLILVLIATPFLIVASGFVVRNRQTFDGPALRATRQ